MPRFGVDCVNEESVSSSLTSCYAYDLVERVASFLSCTSTMESLWSDCRRAATLSRLTLREYNGKSLCVFGDCTLPGVVAPVKKQGHCQFLLISLLVSLSVKHMKARSVAREVHDCGRDDEGGSTTVTRSVRTWKHNSNSHQSCLQTPRHPRSFFVFFIKNSSLCFLCDVGITFSKFSNVFLLSIFSFFSVHQFHHFCSYHMLLNVQFFISTLFFWNLSYFSSILNVFLCSTAFHFLTCSKASKPQFYNSHDYSSFKLAQFSEFFTYLTNFHSFF